MSRVRVLEVIASSRGGGAAHVFDLATHLDAARFAVEVAMPEDGGNVGAADFARQGVPFHALAIDAGFSLEAVRQLRRLMATMDLVHLHGARAALFGRLAAATLGRKRPRIIYTIHGFAAPHYPAPRRQILLGIERALAPLVDRFIAVSHHEQDALVAAGVAQRARVSVVWNGIDVARFQAGAGAGAQVRADLDIPLTATLLTTVCRLFKPRDFVTLLGAIRQLVASGQERDAPPVHLLVVGDGPLRGEIEKEVATLGLTAHVTLAGWRRDLPQIYAASDLFVLTTWGWEGLPLTILEAMAAGKPVVASRAGGIPEEVVEGETGLLVQQQDVAALAAALATMVASPNLRSQAGQTAQARVAKHFALPVMVENTAAVYAQVLTDAHNSTHE